MTKATARKGDGFSIIKIFHQPFSLRPLFPIKTALTARRPLFETLTVSSFRAPNSYALIGIPHPVKPPSIPDNSFTRYFRQRILLLSRRNTVAKFNNCTHNLTIFLRDFRIINPGIHFHCFLIVLLFLISDR